MTFKTNPFHNAFEQAIETGKSVVKSSAKQIKNTFNPLDMLNTVLEGVNQYPSSTETQKSTESQKNNSTPLNFERLQKSYENQDREKVYAMQRHLFQMQKRYEEQSLQQEKQKKAEKERTEAYEEAEKKRREKEKKQMMAQSIEPRGKERKSIFGGKKKKKSAAEPQPTEIKPSTGKQ